MFEKKISAGLPFLIVGLSYLLFKLNKNLYFNIFGHESHYRNALGEHFQFIFYFLSFIFCCLTLHGVKKLPYPATSRLLITLFAALALFIAMEEISWGQRYLNWSTPQFWQNINYQNETTFHNLDIIQKKNASGTNFLRLSFLFTGLFGALGWTVRNRYAFRKMYTILPPVYISTYFLIPAGFYMLVILSFVPWYHQELFETILSMGFLLVAVNNFLRSKSLP